MNGGIKKLHFGGHNFEGKNRIIDDSGISNNNIVNKNTNTFLIEEPEKDNEFSNEKEEGLEMVKDKHDLLLEDSLEEIKKKINYSNFLSENVNKMNRNNNADQNGNDNHEKHLHQLSDPAKLDFNHIESDINKRDCDIAKNSKKNISPRYTHNTDSNSYNNNNKILFNLSSNNFNVKHINLKLLKDQRKFIKNFTINPKNTYNPNLNSRYIRTNKEHLNKNKNHNFSISNKVEINPKQINNLKLEYSKAEEKGIKSPDINNKTVKNDNSHHETNANNNVKKVSPEEIEFGEKIYISLLRNINYCSQIKTLDIKISHIISLDILADNLYSFIINSKNVQKICIETNTADEEFLVKEKTNYLLEIIFAFKSNQINEKILESAKLLITKNFTFFEPDNFYIIYKSNVKLFCNFFKHFKNLFFVKYLKDLTLQNDSIDVKLAYTLRDILEKTNNLEIFEFKSLILKSDLFEIISDKFYLNKLIRKISLINLQDIQEKSLILFFKKIYAEKLNFLILKNLKVGELFLNFMSQNKHLFTNLISFTFKPLTKLYHGIAMLGNFFRNNKPLYEFRINIQNIEDFHKLDEIITDHRFIKFELD